MRKFLISTIIILYSSPCLLAQWQICAPSLLNTKDPQYPSVQKGACGSIIFSDGVLWAGIDELFYSKDTGRTWVKSTLPARANVTDYIQCINFFDRNTGIVGINGSTILITHDGGITWTDLGQGCGQFSNISFLGGPNQIIANDLGVLLSMDGGNSWQNTYTSNNYIKLMTLYHRHNTLFGYDQKQGAPIVSTDLGRSWSTNSFFPIGDTYSMDGDICDSNTFYIANEDWAVRSISDVFVSHDGGKTIFSTFRHGFPYMTGSVSVSREAVFCGTITQDGVIRSTDRGNSWQVIGGAPSPGDSKFICAVNSDIIFMVDTFGNVWRTMNSGGVPYQKQTIPHTTYTKFPTITSCDTVITTFSIASKPCGILYLSKLNLEGGDSSEFLFSGISLPDTIYPGNNLTLPISYNKRFRSGTYSTKLHIKGIYGDYGSFDPYDTLVIVSIIVKPSGPQISSGQSYVRFNTVSTCAFPIDTIITLTNHGCDTLRITQGPGSLSPEFILVPPFQLPIVLPPDSAVAIRFRFAPTKKGNYTANPSFTAEQQGLSQTISLTLEGNGIEEGGILSYEPKKFDFPSLSICAHDSSSGFITNIGCDSMTVDASYFGDVDYSGSGLGVAGWIRPGDTTFYSVYLNPSQKGIRKGFIVLTSKNNIGTALDSIPFTVTVLDGTKILSASQNTLDFGTTSLCSERDTTFVLRNTGCDTLWVLGVGSSGVGFGVKDSSFYIPPGGSATIDVHTNIDTTGHASSNTGVITITSDADNPISPITLTRSITYPKPYTVRFAVGNTSGKNQSIVNMYVIADSLPMGLNRIDANLTIGNSDLLTYLDYQGKNQVTIIGNQLTVTGNPISGDTIATLRYKVYLTNDSTTNISFSNVSFNNSDPDYANCVATVQGADGGAFNYEFVCGEHTIAKLLRNEQIRITSISPNPTKGDVTISIESPIKTEAELHVYDILGKQVMNEMKPLVKGKNTISLDTKRLAKGRYTVQVSSEGSISSSFVKE